MQISALKSGGSHVPVQKLVRGTDIFFMAVLHPAQFGMQSIVTSTPRQISKLSHDPCLSAIEKREPGGGIRDRHCFAIKIAAPARWSSAKPPYLTRQHRAPACLVGMNRTHHPLVLRPRGILDTRQRNACSRTLSLKQDVEPRQQIFTARITHVSIVGFCTVTNRRGALAGHEFVAATRSPVRIRSITPVSAVAEWTT